MYDELVKRLREHNGWALNETLDEAADAIEKLLSCLQYAINWTSEEKGCKDLCAYLPKWIPVTERLPEAGKRVLCYCRANIYEVMKMRTDGDWVYDTNHVYMHSFVTHWMPLPEPPKEEGE